MKKVLIISPYFPPSNAADMQRVRMSLPYFNEFEWEAEVVCVNPRHSDINKDSLLLHSIPSSIKIHEVEAFSKKLTTKVGLGSIALRSLWFFKKKVDRLLKRHRYDVIYFSTTQFPVCILGTYWKKKFGIPFIIDVQDPWHSEYYQDKPKNERPSKYWFSYRLNKYLEPIAMKSVDGLISVSRAYLDTLSSRFENVKVIPKEVITFGAFDEDFEIVRKNSALISQSVKLNSQCKNIVYVGRGGYDMHKALRLVFLALKKGLNDQYDLFSKLRFYFIGTSYASAGKGKKTIQPIAEELGVGNYVIEETDRIPFYAGIHLLQDADALFIPGSDDPGYTASKIYPYLLTRKPIIALFHPSSSASEILQSCYNTSVATFSLPDVEIINRIYEKLNNLADGKLTQPLLNAHNFYQYTARYMTERQCKLFERVLDAK